MWLNLEILSITNQLNNNDFNIEDKNHSGIKIPWNINTKYYNAKVDFWIDETVRKDHVNKEVIQGYENEENGIGKVVDAILFIFKKDEVCVLPKIINVKGTLLIFVDVILKKFFLKILLSHQHLMI